MKLIKKISLACLLGSTSFVLQAKTQVTPENWKTECVGYFQISLPGEVEIGVVQNDPDPSKGTHNLEKWGNQFFASSIYRGGVRTSSELPERSFLRIKKAKDSYIEELKEEAKKDPAVQIIKYESGPESLLLSYYDNDWYYGYIYIYRAGRIYFFDTSRKVTSSTKEKFESDLSHFSQNFRSRALYELPKERGFCMPYGFVKDDRPQKRSMGTIMRLKDHPDVRILFRDQSALFEENYSKEENASVEQELRAFWERPDWGGVKYQALGFRKFPSVQMGGYKGQSTFVEITRPSYSPIYECAWDEEYFSKAEKKRAGCLPPTLDYGYIAYVKGDPDAKEDTPNLLLYVMQNSKDAPDGKPTIGKDELKKMADTIAASIKRR